MRQNRMSCYSHGWITRQWVYGKRHVTHTHTLAQHKSKTSRQEHSANDCVSPCGCVTFVSHAFVVCLAPVVVFDMSQQHGEEIFALFTGSCIHQDFLFH